MLQLLYTATILYSVSKFTEHPFVMLRTLLRLCDKIVALFKNSMINLVNCGVIKGYFSFMSTQNSKGLLWHIHFLNTCTKLVLTYLLVSHIFLAAGMLVSELLRSLVVTK